MDAKKTRQGRNSDGTPHLNAKATRQERNSDETPYAGVIRESDPHPAAFLEKGKTHVKAHWSHGNTHAGHYVQKAGAPLRASVSTHHQRRFFALRSARTVAVDPPSLLGSLVCLG